MRTCKYQITSRDSKCILCSIAIDMEGLDIPRDRIDWIQCFPCQAQYPPFSFIAWLKTKHAEIVWALKEFS